MEKRTAGVALICDYKKSINTLHVLKSIFGKCPIGQITDAEIVEALRVAARLKALRAEVRAKRKENN